MTKPPKLLVVYLGGSAPRANTELHDVVFVVGDTIQSTYDQLLEAWFGSPDGLHIDSWAFVDIIDGHRVSLSSTPAVAPKKLFFVNMGAYVNGEFGEIHANAFFVGEEVKEVIRRAKMECLRGAYTVHRDYLYDVDECLEVSQIGRWFVHLEPTDEGAVLSPVSAYHLIPKDLVSAFKLRRKSATLPSASPI